MSERRYTLTEIDRMRAGLRECNKPALPSIITFESVGGDHLTMSAASAAQLAEFERRCEIELRTALIAGVDPAEFDMPPKKE